MRDKYFVVNIGSDSKKYALYEGTERRFFAHFEKEAEAFIVTFETGVSKEKRMLSEKDYGNALAGVLEEIKRSGAVTAPEREIRAVGFRVVAPGSFFQKHRLVDSDFVKRLKSERGLAPLHAEPMLAELGRLDKLLPKIPVIAVSDSAFHAAMPPVASVYAIPHAIAEKFEIRRFGYHGISFSSVVRKVKATLGTMPSRVIMCHLGNGASVTAVKDGQSVDTSMGFTPLEGLVMGTRSGDIDPGALIELAKRLKLSPDKLESFLYHECGLLGVSGESNDIRDLLKLEKEGDSRAALALDLFAYRIKKYIGAYAAALNGFDLVTFSGGIGERSFAMRERVMRGLDGLGLALDQSKNNAAESVDAFINQESSKDIAVIVTDEMGEIAAIAATFLKVQP